MSIKIPMTPSVIEPATFELVAKRLNKSRQGFGGKLWNKLIKIFKYPEKFQVYLKKSRKLTVKC